MKHIHKTLLSRLFDDDNFNPPAWRPAVDIYRTRTGWLLKFELAGVSLEDLRLEISDHTLRLSGTRRDLCCGEFSKQWGCIHQTMEIAYSSFERSVELPLSLAGATIRPELANGMLLVHIEMCNHERQHET